MTSPLSFVSTGRVPEDVSTLMVVGTRERLRSAEIMTLIPADFRPVWEVMVASLGSGDDGDVATSWLPGTGPLRRLLAGSLPEKLSRHNSPAAPHAITSQIRKHAPREGSFHIVLALTDPAHAFAAGCAVARAFSLFTVKSKVKEGPRVTVSFAGFSPSADEIQGISLAAAAIRDAACWVDTPTAELHTDALVERARALAKEVGASCTVIQGQELKVKGLGGLWGVGKAATRPPALVVLSHEPEGAARSFAWVGKGIVYDTGGLSLKDRNSMPGMKMDMGGAAAVLAAFGAAVKIGTTARLHAVLCLAENAIGSRATRNDDVLTLYSGKTVEINNTDAEGRLVLGDGVAYAARHLSPEVIIDLATLTGAQLVATGKRHAAVVSNDEDLERLAVRAGRSSGDLVHPLPYCPEFFRREFKSQVADMKNSVKDRMNGQSSCAAGFVAEHLSGFAGPWLHVDMAGPVEVDGRGSGYGVALLLRLLEDLSDPATFPLGNAR